MINKYLVLGGGAWGTAIANTIAQNYGQVTLYLRDKYSADEINTLHVNSKYFPGLSLSNSIYATSDLKQALQSDIWFLSIPCNQLRNFFQDVKKYQYINKKIIICCKGIEIETLMFPSNIVNEELPGMKIGILSGPNFAVEIIKFLPSFATLAFDQIDNCKEIIKDISSKFFNIGISDDVKGIEVSGAIKNIIAIICGIARGMGLGQNTIAALITQGLSEITKVALFYGSLKETMLNVAVVGDLILSCTSDSSRNYQFGFQLGQGRSLNVLLEKGTTTEGYKSSLAIFNLSKKWKLSLPIVECLYKILYQSSDIRKNIDKLISSCFISS